MSRVSLSFHRRNWWANHRPTGPYLTVGGMLAALSLLVSVWGVVLLAVLWVLWVTGVSIGWIR